MIEVNVRGEHPSLSSVTLFVHWRQKSARARTDDKLARKESRSERAK